MKLFNKIINNDSKMRLLVNNEEVESVVDCYFSGLLAINQSQGIGSSFFSTVSNGDISKRKELACDFVSELGKPSYLKNPDLFYSILQFGHFNSYCWVGEQLPEYIKLEPKDFVQVMLSGAMPDEDAFDALHEKLNNSLSRQVRLDDDQLKRKACGLFSVEDISLLVHEKTILFTKINHGYWEFLLNSFVNVSSVDKVRDLSAVSHPKSWRRSGFHAILFDAFNSVIEDAGYGDWLKIAISLSAGDMVYKDTIASDLSVVSRGALAGMTGFFEALGLSDSVKLFDGCAPRNIIKNNEFYEFFGVQLNSYDALLLIVPPGLKGINFPLYEGAIYKLTVPGQTVHETSRVVLPTIIGAIDRLINKHERVCVITQSAVLAPLVAIYIYKLFAAHKDSLSFFDLGRILDIVRPDIATSVPTLSWVFKAGLDNEISTCMSMTDSNCDFWLCQL